MLLDKLTAIFAPARCFKCEQVGSSLCAKCHQIYLEEIPSRCYRCHKATNQHQVCKTCRASIKLNHFWVYTLYDGLSKELIHSLKFERSGYLAKDIAKILTDFLPILPEGTIITHVPTAPKRIRIRGYDQSKLIARHISELKKLEYTPLFTRTSNSRQVGASREQRFKQVKDSFELSKKFTVKNKKILIVDDVTTSGATIEHLAKLLKSAGAKSIDAVVFAQAID